MKRFWYGLAIFLPLLLGACATITPVSGTFTPNSPHEAQSGTLNGRQVRWGGILIHTQPEATQTCFTVMGLPLHQNGQPEPKNGEHGAGRFIACIAGFYDPVLYSAGREITFIGVIKGVRKEKVGTYTYPYPMLQASVVYLWPRRIRRPEVNESVSIFSGWGYPGWWYGPGWW